MYRTTIHTRFFRLIYNSPKRSDIIGCVKISVNNTNYAFWINTFKDLILSFANMLTDMASFRSVSGSNRYNRNATQRSLIFQKRPKLSKRPVFKFCSKFFVPSFSCKSNVGQILNRNSFALFFGRLNDSFCNCVVLNCGSSSFFAPKPFLQFFRTACAFALNRATNLSSFFSVLIEPFGRIFFTVRSNRNISQPKIHSYKLFHVFNVSIGNLYRLKQIEFALIKNKISLPFNVWEVFRIVANERHFKPTTSRPNRNNVRHIRKYSAIIGNAPKRSERPFNFLIQFVRVGYFGYAANQNLCAKFRRTFYFVIHFVVNLKLIKNLVRPCYFRNIVANSVSLFNSLKQEISLFFRRQKFDFQCKFQDTNLIQIFDKIN